MLYRFFDFGHALLTPARFGAQWMHNYYSNPFNLLTHTQFGRNMAANAEMFERMTRRFGKPAFNLSETKIGGQTVSVHETCMVNKPFCTLMHFNRHIDRKDPKVLLVAPMSGHYATLLRGTVEALLPHHDVYITDWIDARQVPKEEGRFNLDDYIAYLREFMAFLGPDTHVIAVCQPAVPVFAAVALMEADKDPNTPRSMALMGGPIDTRISKTAVTELAENRPLSWFEHSVIAEVPFYYPGAYRKVYPGFVQLSGFMSMNLDRHIGSHMEFYQHLITGDGESAESHRKFYNEYLSVMDISAEFYLQTVETVFQKHSLPKNEMVWTDPETGKKHPVRPAAIRKTALLTIEGEFDDISAYGQTSAAHDLCPNLPPALQYHHYQKKVGHYGIFNGRRWREHIMPRMRHFIRKHDNKTSPIPKADLEKISDKRPDHWHKESANVVPLEQRAK